MNTLRVWILAIRPKTLSASVAPVLIGTSIAYSDGLAHLPSAIAALLGALFIQIGTNFANDYFDYVKGADTTERAGPVRVTQAGLVTPPQIKAAMGAAFGLAALCGIYLVSRGGLPLAVIGVLSILSGILYTASPLALGYLGLGDLFVLVFFGPVAVGGTYYAQTLSISPLVLFAGLAPGFLAMAILAVNNLRDHVTDAKAGKKTLVVRFGESFGKLEYLASVGIASFIPVLLYAHSGKHASSIACVAVLAAAVPAFRAVLGSRQPSVLNDTLAYTGKLLLLFSAVFSISQLLP